MKTIIIAFLFAACLFNLPALGQPDYKSVYEKKIKSYQKMKNAGGALAIVGSVFTAAGTALLVTIPSIEEDEYGYTSNEDQIALQASGGVICLAVGIEILVAGIVVGSVGARKQRQYKTKLDNLSMRMICSPKQQGIMLTYRF